MKTYYIGQFGEVRFKDVDRDADGALAAPERDAEYQAWLSEGNTPEPAAVPPPIVPQSVSMRQGREALIRRGYFAAVNNHIMGMAGIDGEIARNEWEMSQVIERNRPLTLAMAQLIGLSAEGMDELFTYASTL